MKLKTFFALSSFFLTSLTLAAVPNTFSDGEVVSASKINENFTAANRRLVTLLDDQDIGVLMSYDGYNALTFSYAGYIAKFGMGSSVTLEEPMNTIYFTGSSCTGTPYITDGGYLGRVFRVNTSVYYLPHSSSLSSSVSYASTYYSGCSASAGTINAYQVQSNDSNTTGIPNGLHGGSVKFGFQ